MVAQHGINNGLLLNLHNTLLGGYHFSLVESDYANGGEGESFAHC